MAIVSGKDRNVRYCSFIRTLKISFLEYSGSSSLCKVYERFLDFIWPFLNRVFAAFQTLFLSNLESLLSWKTIGHSARIDFFLKTKTRYFSDCALIDKIRITN